MPADLGFSGAEKFGVSPDGIIAATGGSMKLHIIRRGEPPRTVTLREAGVNAKWIRAIAIDAKNRVWLGTDYGLAVVDEHAKLIRHYEPGTLAGVNGEVKAIAVIGDGPPSLPAKSEQRKGTVTGKVLKGSQPVSGADVELCPSPLPSMDEPCKGASFHRSVKTAADGTFKFEGVPLGTFGLAYRSKSRWKQQLLTRCCSQLKNADAVDVGVLKLD